MKKIICAIILILCINACSYGFSAGSNDIKSKIEIIEKETNTYAGEDISLENRLKNAEIYVFGTAKKGDFNERIKSLADVLGLSAQFNPGPKVAEEPKYEFENYSNTNYPSVDKMEMEKFKTAYKNENIYKRLDRLENKVFGHKSDKSLNERVADLQDHIFKSKSDNLSALTKPDYEYPDYNYYSPQNYNVDLSKIEKKFFRKTYEKENLSTRLSRIETKLFSKDFAHEDNQTRLERLNSVQKAAKSGTEYKINKFAKYAVAGAQIGGILLLILAMIL